MSRAILLLLLVPILALGQAFTANDLPFLSQGGGTDWERRVVSNGGAQPSANTVEAMETLRTGLIAAGLTNKIHSLIVLVPDSVIAATTPLIKHKGSDPWTNLNFVTGDLTIDGLKGDGTTKSLDSGVKAKSGEAVNSGTGNVGMTVIVSESSGNRSESEMVHADAAGAKQLGLVISEVAPTAGDTAFFTRGVAANQFATKRDWGASGYVSGNSVAGVLSIYRASTLVPHYLLVTLAAVTDPTTSERTIPCFAANTNGSIAGWSTKRLSVAAIHDGFTSAESASFASLLIACRQSLGGGDGNEVDDWGFAVVRLGGAAPSTATKNALKTAYASMAAQNLITNHTGNFFVPDSLIAAQVPLFWNAGTELWTNNAFAASNLTVNGLQGDGTSKYLNTGVNMTTAFGISATANAGLTIFTPSTTTTGVEFGSANTGSSVNDTYLAVNAGGTCAVNLSGSAQQIALASPGTGFYSGERVSSTSLILYRATSTNAFSALATNANAGAAALNSVMFSHAVRNTAVSGPASWSSKILSFAGVHPGYTAVQASNLFFILSTARGALGGGNP